MAYTRDPVFRHGKFLVDSSGIDASLRPKYDYVLQEMAQADGITLLHAGLRTSAEDDLLILEPHCFDFDFQSAMKYFCTLEALMQADGIALGRQLRFQGKPCNTIEHRRVADTHVDGMSYQPGVEVLVTPKETEEDDDQWVDVSEELQSIDAVNQQSSLETRLASLGHDQKLAYLIVVREICEKDGLACNIGQAYAETPQIGLLRAIWEEELPEVLLRYQSLKHSNGTVPLHAALFEAIKSARLRLVDFFLDEGAQLINTDYERAVIWYHQSPALYDILLEKAWHEKQTNCRFLDKYLDQACTAGRDDMVRYLKEKGAKPRKAPMIACTAPWS